MGVGETQWNWYSITLLPYVVLLALFTEAIINDNLVSKVLTMGALLGGASAAFVGALVAAAIISDYWVGIAFVCFLVCIPLTARSHSYEWLSWEYRW